MPKLPIVSEQETVRALERAGFVFNHQRSSHIILYHEQRRRTATVSVHGSRDLAPGTLHEILRQAGLTVDEFIALLD